LYTWSGSSLISVTSTSPASISGRALRELFASTVPPVPPPKMAIRSGISRDLHVEAVVVARFVDRDQLVVGLVDPLGDVGQRLLGVA